MNFKEYYASVKDLELYLKQECNVAYSTVTGRKYLKLVAIGFSIISSWLLFEGYTQTVVFLFLFASLSFLLFMHLFKSGNQVVYLSIELSRAASQIEERLSDIEDKAGRGYRFTQREIEDGLIEVRRLEVNVRSLVALTSKA